MSVDRAYKRPESVLVVVHRPPDEVLLLRRVEPPDWWQSVTGSLEWGESPQAAAARELLEETGIAGDGALRETGVLRRFPIVEPWRRRYAPEALTNDEHEFFVEIGREVRVRLNPAEHQAYRWLPWRQAARLATSWTNREAIMSAFS